jgi:hypothetical protein
MVAGLFPGCTDNKNNTIVVNSPATTESKVSTVPRAAVDHKTMKGKLTFWHCNIEEDYLIKKAFEKEFPNVELKLMARPDSEYSIWNKYMAAFKSGTNLPDVFSVESTVVKEFIEMPDYYLDITEKAREVSEDMAKYTIDIGTDSKGAVKVLTHQITPCGIGYKKAVANKYLGTDNPDKIAAMLSSPDKILETAKRLKEASNGKVALFPSWEEMEKYAIGGCSAGWVVYGKLNIERKVLDLIEFSKKMRDNKYEAGFDTWSTGWAKAIADDETAMCWTIPPWGVNWIIGSHDGKSRDGGRWSMCKGPDSYVWGGTWYGIYSKSQNTELAWEFIKWRTTDKEHLKEWTNQTGDIPNSMSLLSKYAADSTKVDNITDINLFKFYQGLVGDINGATFGQYDEKIENSFKEVMKSYLDGKIATKDGVVKMFKDKVKEEVKEITVE